MSAKEKPKVDRLEKAREILANGEVQPVDGKYRVYRVRDYDVELHVPVTEEQILQSCTCPDHKYRGVLRCKHILAALLYEGVPEEEIADKGVAAASGAVA